MRGKGEKCEKESLRCRITPAYAGKSCGRCCCVCVTEDHPRLCGEKDSMTDQREQPHRITPAYAGKSFRKTAVRHAIKDHPRLCGEKLLGNKNVRERQGSPPPMRGKVAGIAALIAIFGITPAYAGKSFHVDRITGNDLDHPRLCGEKRKLSRLLIFSLGSPPPMRGKAEHFPPEIMRHRITPAYAGKSMMPASDVQRSTDHPRLCGEKIVSSVMLYPSIGSPPPMRGKGLTIAAKPSFVRITPAYAGKRSASRGHVETVRDHPRLCGEKGNSKGLRGALWGSPPPMRGKVGGGMRFKFPFGITPAYAGKSGKVNFVGKTQGDHPRLCGEKRAVRIHAPHVPGSPPPMRGKVRYFGLLTNHKGITPAYAGKSLWNRKIPLCHWDHPRLCGEKRSGGSTSSFVRGSPPPMRGKVRRNR